MRQFYKFIIVLFLSSFASAAYAGCTHFYTGYFGSYVGTNPIHDEHFPSWCEAAGGDYYIQGGDHKCTVWVYVWEDDTPDPSDYYAAGSSAEAQALCIAGPPEPPSCTVGDSITHTHPFKTSISSPYTSPPTTISSGGCSYVRDVSQPGGRCAVSPDNGNINCIFPYKGTGNASVGGETTGDPDSSPVDTGVPELAPNDQITTTVAAPTVQPDTPSPGDTTTTNETVETKTTPPKSTVTNTESQTSVIQQGEKTVTKTTTTTNITHADGSTETVTDTEYTHSDQLQTEDFIQWGSTEITSNQDTVPGSTGTTTTTTTTNPDGSSSTTTESTGEGGDGPGETDENGEEYPAVESKGENQYDSKLDDTGINDLIGGLGTDDPGAFSFSSPLTAVTGGSCQSITNTWKGYSFTFPGSQGCVYLNQLKSILAFVLYVLTAYSIFELATRRVN